MTRFGETIRDLRVAQGLGLREAAQKAGISPAYLSRIERDKESPPRPEIIKELARILAADPDVLFRLASSTDPEVLSFIHENPRVLALLRLMEASDFTEEDTDRIIKKVKRMSNAMLNK